MGTLITTIFVIAVLACLSIYLIPIGIFIICIIATESLITSLIAASIAFLFIWILSKE